MNKLGIFVNFWEKNWACDLARYIRKASNLGFDILEFQAQALLDMSKEKMDELKKIGNCSEPPLTVDSGICAKRRK